MARELDSGGCERDLTRFAKAVNRERFEPHVACFRPGGLRFEELKAAGVPVTCFSVQSLVGVSGISGAIDMHRYLRRHRIGLVHAFDAPTGLFAAPVALSLRVPIIESNLWFRDAIHGRLRHGLRFLDRVADAIMVNSSAVKQQLVRDEGVSADRIHLCYNGVDISIFKPEPTPRPHAVQNATLVIGSVCGLRAEKRLDRLIEAFASVRPLMPGMKLLIVGSGAMLPSLQALNQKLGLQDACIFEPSTRDVAKWMCSIDIFVLPSDTESFPNGVLEAMACGCAVIGSRVGGVPELIEEGRSGLLFDTKTPDSLAEALEKLIQDGSLRKRLAEAAAARASVWFSLARSVDCIETMYEKVLSVRRPGSRA
jgi:glycosyltransferase involved in cell wall biosynthesis